MSHDEDDEKSKTLVFANPLGDRLPRPSPGYVSKSEHREVVIRLEALEKTLEAHANRLSRLESRFMQGQVETQGQFKTLLSKFEELISWVKEARK